MNEKKSIAIEIVKGVFKLVGIVLLVLLTFGLYKRWKDRRSES